MQPIQLDYSGEDVQHCIGNSQVKFEVKCTKSAVMSEHCMDARRATEHATELISCNAGRPGNYTKITPAPSQLFLLCHAACSVLKSTVALAALTRLRTQLVERPRVARNGPSAAHWTNNGNNWATAGRNA